MTRITAEELKTLESGTKIQVVWLRGLNKEYRGVIHEDKVNWEDGSHNEICEIVIAIQNGRCTVML